MPRSVPRPLTADDARPRLTAGRDALLHLHRTLLHSERVTYERAHGRIQTSGAFFQLVLKDAWFVWLRQLSSLIVQIDELLESEEPVVAANAASALGEAQTLLAPRAEDPAFGQQYLEALQRDPDVVIAHREALVALQH